jgi:hypothetical protein
MRRISSGILVLIAILAVTPVHAQDRAAIVARALQAAPASITDNAAVMDWGGNMLREGTNVSDRVEVAPHRPNVSGRRLTRNAGRSLAHRDDSSPLPERQCSTHWSVCCAFSAAM